MKLSPDRIEEMLKAAEAATPGPWLLLAPVDDWKAGIDQAHHLGGNAIVWVTQDPEEGFKRAEDAAHLANCDPATIRSLLTELLSLREHNERQGEATHRHKKRGSSYVLIGIGKMQTEEWRVRRSGSNRGDQPRVDMREVAIYRDVEDGSLWVRPREEFEDGRFVTLSEGSSNG